METTTPTPGSWVPLDLFAAGPSAAPLTFHAVRDGVFVHEQGLCESDQVGFGPGATIGANSTVLCGIEIGARAFVGAGSVVCDDLPAHAFALGSPARRIGWACFCGNRLEKGPSRLSSKAR